MATPATLTLTGPTGVGSVNATCAGRGRPGGQRRPAGLRDYTVAYVFTGFAAPVRGDVVNTANRGPTSTPAWPCTWSSGKET
ncbi:hypothetical protein Hesp01_37440 [Herbidospora sp. NBRC 101105]|nr:hypothetical protein Hesp01_37440 [Herbidospora sp. NBRC 101105]